MIEQLTYSLQDMVSLVGQSNLDDETVQPELTVARLVLNRAGLYLKQKQGDSHEQED